MKKSDAKKRIQKLRVMVSKYRSQMHITNDLEISEEELDSLKKELSLLEDKYPEFLDPTSPTQVVAGGVLRGFKKHIHSTRMLSLSDVFSREELTSWIEKTIKSLERDDLSYFLEAKIDGLAASLHYKNGRFEIGATRGDGFVGENITQNFLRFETLPREIPTKDSVEFRGEVYLPYEAFVKLNKKRIDRGESAYANPRNAASGLLRQINPDSLDGVGLEFFIYDMVNPEKFGIKTHHEVHEFADRNGFPTAHLTKEAHSIKEIFDYYYELISKRESYSFGIDGLVVLLDKLEDHDALGVVGKSPKYAVAFKFPAVRSTSVVESICVQVGRTGVLTPVAHLTPTLLDGSTISRATLHNQDEIDRKDIMVGDTVSIQKAGDIIPEVVGVLKKFRDGSERHYSIPSRCPECDTKTVRDDGKSAIYCPNPSCPAKSLRLLQHFVSKSGLDIIGFGDQLASLLIEKKLIASREDIFTITFEDLIHLEGIQEQSAQNLIEAISGAKRVRIAKFLAAIGIHGVGVQTAIDLEKHLMQFYQTQLTPSELFSHFTPYTEENFITKFDGIGEVLSRVLVSYFEDQDNKDLYDRFTERGVVLEFPEGQTGELVGKTYVITGTFEVSRLEIKAFLESRGAKVSSSVSKKTNMVLVGENPGSKREKAKSLGIPIGGLKEIGFVTL